MLNAADLPDDVAALKAMLIAAQAREAGKDAEILRKDEPIERLEKRVADFKQAAFGRKSEKTDPDQFELALEVLETAMAAIQAEDEADAPAGNRINKPRATNRGSLPTHLPRVEEVIEPESLVCACGGWRTIRPIALNRKNAFFSGHDAGAENWAPIASLIETYKLDAVDPQAYLTATLTAIVNGHKQSRIDDLLPWNYARCAVAPRCVDEKVVAAA
jgi:hypothetical protein